MNMHNTAVRAALGAALATSITMASAFANANAADSRPAITMSEARVIALKAYPSKIVKEELEHEKGGSGLRYSFDMRQDRHWREIGVDAMTGKVLENVREGANPKD